MNRHDRKLEREREGGAALVFAMLILVVITLLASVGFFRANMETVDVRRVQKADETLATADRGVEWGEARLVTGKKPVVFDATTGLRVEDHLLENQSGKQLSVRTEELPMEEDAPSSSDELMFGFKYDYFRVRSDGAFTVSGGGTRRAAIDAEFQILRD